MALTQDELQAVKNMRASGLSTMEITRQLAKRRSGSAMLDSTSDAPERTSFLDSFGQSIGIAVKQPNALERVGNVIEQQGRTVQEAISGEGEFAGRSDIRRGFEAAGAAATAIPAVAVAAAPEPVRTVLGKAGEVFTNVINFLGEKVGSIPAITKWVEQNPEAARNLEEIAGTTKAAGDISSTILLAQGAASGAQKAVDVGSKGVQKAGQVIASTIDKARPATKALYERSSEIIKPTPTPAKAMGEVLQAKKPLTTKDVQAFKNIDTTKVKTYADLKGQVDESIAKLSGQVDDYLAQDPTVVPLSKLVTRTTSGSGRVIERNFVETAIGHLKELYTTAADDVARADIDDLLAKAQTTGLTRLEVNDISRLYNSEFGSKAFSKVTGEPLTSVNAQAYENIRSGLKDVARKGMGGAEAAATDKIISSLYNVKDLVTKNVAAVQRLQQRIAERGLVEKVGYIAAKYGDILTGGSLRGFIGGLLPRGAGYKIMNALDLEERLAKNLEIIRKAIESGADDIIIKATKQLEASVSAQ